MSYPVANMESLIHQFAFYFFVRLPCSWFHICYVLLFILIREMLVVYGLVLQVLFSLAILLLEHSCIIYQILPLWLYPCELGYSTDHLAKSRKLFDNKNSLSRLQAQWIFWYNVNWAMMCHVITSYIIQSLYICLKRHCFLIIKNKVCQPVKIR